MHCGCESRHRSHQLHYWHSLSLKEENEVHLIRLSSSGTALVCEGLFSHPNEIWDLASCPFDQPSVAAASLDNSTEENDVDVSTSETSSDENFEESEERFSSPDPSPIPFPCPVPTIRDTDIDWSSISKVPSSVEKKRFRKDAVVAASLDNSIEETDIDASTSETSSYENFEELEERFSSPDPPPIPFPCPVPTTRDTDIDWSSMSKVPSSAEKKRLRKDAGKRSCVRLSTIYAEIV
ncbi:hypothetical protein AgCh_007377 [Apium graveolens]